MLLYNERIVNLKHKWGILWALFHGWFFGLIAGILAKWIMPGKDGGGFFMTIILGVVGAVVGGWISTFFGFGKVDGFNFGSFVVAVIGAIVVLFIYRKVKS